MISLGFPNHWVNVPCPYGFMDFMECGKVGWDENQVTSGGVESTHQSRVSTLTNWSEGRRVGESVVLRWRRGIIWYRPWVEDIKGSPWRWKLSCPWARTHFQYGFCQFSTLMDPHLFPSPSLHCLPFPLVLFSFTLPSVFFHINSLL